MSADTNTATRWSHRSLFGFSAGIGRLVEPVRILLGSRSLSRLLVAFAAINLAEWAYVTALAIDAFRKSGAIAVGLVGFRLFFAAVSSFLSIAYVERHPGPGSSPSWH